MDAIPRKSSTRAGMSLQNDCKSRITNNRAKRAAGFNRMELYVEDDKCKLNSRNQIQFHFRCKLYKLEMV